MKIQSRFCLGLALSLLIQTACAQHKYQVVAVKSCREIPYGPTFYEPRPILVKHSMGFRISWMPNTDKCSVIVGDTEGLPVTIVGHWKLTHLDGKLVFDEAAETRVMEAAALMYLSNHQLEDGVYALKTNEKREIVAHRRFNLNDPSDFEMETASVNPNDLRIIK